MLVRSFLSFTILCFGFLNIAGAQSVQNGDFSSWTGGSPTSWEAIDGIRTTRVSGWDGDAARLGLNSGASVTAALRQVMSGSFSDRFEVAFDFTQTTSGTERGANLTLRQGTSTPLLSWRVGPDGAVETFDGSSWRSLTPPQSILANDLSDIDLDRVYRVTITGSLQNGVYRLRVESVGTGSMLVDSTGLTHWQSNPVGQSLNRLSFERGRSGGDYIVDNVAIRIPAAHEIDDGSPEDPIGSNGEHPFLLFSADDLPDLRARASREPWTSMASDAIDRAHNLSYDPSLPGGYRARVLRLKEVVAALSLAVIVDDQTESSFYAERFQHQLTTGLTHLSQNRPTNDWDGNTPVGSLLFDAILALDVFHNHLAESELAELQSLLDTWVPSISRWEPSPQAVAALWALYRGDATAYASNRAAYLDRLFQNFTADGVYVAGTNYALARFTFYDREQKHLLLDIMRRHDEIPAHREELIRRGYEWIFGYAMAPHGWNHVFGDSSPNRRVHGALHYPRNSPTAVYRAKRFSTDAQAYANYHLLEPIPFGGLIYYVLYVENLDTVPPQVAPSRIFADGGAWLQTDNGSFGSLSGAMWNATREEGHSHKETNALSLVAYDELLLSNSGYAGWGSGDSGFSWTYINNRAISGNTVLINYPITDARNAPSTNDHHQKRGAGISRSLLSGEVDYAKGDSGNALPNGKHFRHFSFVHPLDGMPGYWVVLDEVQGNSGATTTHAAWHPYSENLDTISPGEHFRAHCQQFSENGVTLHIHLSNQPAQIQILEGLIAHFNDLSFVGDFLYNTYSLNPERYVRFGTILLPEAPDGPVPAFSRESGANWQASRLSWPDGSVDYWVVTSNNQTATVGPIEFRGKSAWFRLSPSGQIKRKLLIEGDSFSPANDDPAWFSAPEPGTFYSGPDQFTLSNPNSTPWQIQKPGINRLHGSDGARLESGPTGLPLSADATGTFSVNRPRLPLVGLQLSSGHIHLQASALDPTGTYQWQSSSNLTTWTPLGTVIEGKSTSAYNLPPAEDRRFFRLQRSLN